MKEQYIGDVKDYGKYRFLRTLYECTGLKIGANWYLTSDDTSNQGNFGRILSCTDELYSKVIGLKNIKATLFDVEHSGILPASTVYYHAPLNYYHNGDNKTLRTKWHGNALNALGACDIIFLDPDTGVVANDFLNPNGQIRDSFYKCNERRDGTRYVLLEEIEDYLTAGKSLILFQYGQRMGIEPQLKSVYERLAQYFSIPSCTFIFRYSSSSADAIAFICYNQTKHSYAFTRFASALQDKSNVWSNYYSLWEVPLISVLEMTGNNSDATLLRQNCLDVDKKNLEVSMPMLDKIKARQMANANENRQTGHPKKTTSQTDLPSQGLASSREKLRALVLKIPEGKVTTYGWLAKQIYNNTGATLAVLSMIKSITGTSVPCHRVVSSDGKPKASDLNYGNTGKTQKQLLHSEGVVFTDSETIDFDKYMFRPVIDGE